MNGGRFKRALKYVRETLWILPTFTVAVALVVGNSLSDPDIAARSRLG